jgi:ferric-dicitrate binding protein FerR (iron transport regulator)
MSTPPAALAAWLDGEADAAQAEALATWLRADPAHRREFAHLVALTREIRAASAATGEPGQAGAPSHRLVAATGGRRQATGRQRVRRGRKSPTAVRWLLPSALAALVLVAVLLAQREARVGEEPLVASLRGEVHLGAVPARAGAAVPVGSRIMVGGDGALRLRFPDRTHIDLVAGTSCELASLVPKRLELQHGSALADVAPQPAGAPLVIATRRGDAVVRGTTLRVDADPSATALTVHGGLVALRTPDGAALDVPAGRWALADAAGTRSAPLGEAIFVMGIDFGGRQPVTIAGQRWRTADEAERGGLAFAAPVEVADLASPELDAPDPVIDRMLDTTIWARQHLRLAQALPPGRYRVQPWIHENRAAGVRSFTLALEGGIRASGIGRDHRGGSWHRLGPFDVEVGDGALDLDAEVDAEIPGSDFNHPHLSGLIIERLPPR